MNYQEPTMMCDAASSYGNVSIATNVPIKKSTNSITSNKTTPSSSVVKLVNRSTSINGFELNYTQINKDTYSYKKSI